MKAFALTLALLAAPAWATGERLLVSGPAAEQLKETLCVSMECVSLQESRERGLDVTVEAKAAKGGLLIEVSGANGKHYATVKAPLSEGRLGSTDLVSATSAIIRAIENPEARSAPEKPKAKVAVAKKHKAPRFRLAAR
jgi:hypothetical protein